MKYIKRYLYAYLLFLALLSCKHHKNDFLVLAKYDGQANFLSNEYLFEGNPVLKVSSANQYGLTSSELAIKPHEIYEASFWQRDYNPLCFLVANFDVDQYQYSNYAAKDSGAWTQVKMLLVIPENLTTKKLKFFVSNQTEKVSYIDKLAIKKLADVEVNSLPDYAFYPLLFDLLQTFSLKNLKEPSILDLKEICDNAPPKLLAQHGIQDLTWLTNSLKLKLDKQEDIFGELHRMKTKSHYVSVSDTPEDNMFFDKLSIYSNEYLYSEKDNEMTLFVGTSPGIDTYDIVVERLNDPYKKEHVLSIQSSDTIFKLNIGDITSGFYEIHLEQEGVRSNAIPLIKQTYNHELIILAPVTTWHAYNSFGGKSFYRNVIDELDVNYISTLRPLNSVDFDSVYLGNDIFILKNIFDWFNSKWKTSIYPDYYLEQYPELFDHCKTIVIAQHNEYYSYEMRAKLEALNKTANIISLGGNQIYWKVKWHDDFSTLEVHKDGDFFKNSNLPGGLWRNAISDEASLTGVAYDGSGYASYAPYQILAPDHWIFNQINIPNNKVFGIAGIDGRGLSGDETDKITHSSPSNIILLAKGLNPNKGGGEITYFEKGKIANYACGSIACGSGLGKDEVFSKMLENFMFKHHKSN